ALARVPLVEPGARINAADLLAPPADQRADGSAVEVVRRGDLLPVERDRVRAAVELWMAEVETGVDDEDALPRSRRRQCAGIERAEPPVAREGARGNARLERRERAVLRDRPDEAHAIELRHESCCCGFGQPPYRRPRD